MDAQQILLSKFMPTVPMIRSASRCKCSVSKAKMLAACGFTVSSESVVTTANVYVLNLIFEN